MLLERFRIVGYKSIIDSGICDVCDDLTILAGKNETGKSTLLEALRDFNTDVTLNDSVRTKDRKDTETSLTLWFNPTIAEIELFNRQYLTKLSSDKKSSVGVVKKTTGYSILPETIRAFGSKENAGFSLSKEREKTLLSFIPNFILFDSFNDIIQDKIPINQIAGNSFMKDFSAISNLDINMLASPDATEFARHREEINLALNQDYEKYWVQDNTKIQIECLNNAINVLIKEGGQYFTPQQRSKGKQWHLSFYVRIKAKSLEDRTNVILIDEPGLFLHAAAQKDVYKMLLSLKPTSQVIYTTHSPYLIRPDELYRLRLVTKDDPKITGTQVVNKLHAVCDKETLTPILTAIGLELNSGIHNVDKKNNIVVEGPSDCFYLQAITRLYDIHDLNFVFGGGAGNMGNIGTILSGWGCNVIYLFDNDQGGKDGSKNLVKNWRVAKELIMSVKKSGTAIEDLFTKTDFKKYMLVDVQATYDGLTSKYIKDNSCNKVEMAQNFARLVANKVVELSDNTKGNFIALLDTFRESFNNLYL